jgi:hypothetical protein
MPNYYYPIYQPIYYGGYYGDLEVVPFTGNYALDWFLTLFVVVAICFIIIIMCIPFLIILFKIADFCFDRWL